MVKRFLSLGLMLMVVLPLLAQSPVGHGVIVALPASNSICSASVCRSVSEWLYPTLFAIDPITGIVIPSSDVHGGVAKTHLLTRDVIQKIELRDDLFWGDGQPITAYDVLFSLLAESDNITQEIKAIAIDDDYTLTVEFVTPDCAAPAQLNVLIQPAHIWGQNFARNVQSVTENKPVLYTIQEWFDTGVFYYESSLNWEQVHRATAGSFVIKEFSHSEPYRLVSGETAIIIRDLYAISPDVTGSRFLSINATQAFLGGEVSYLINPPLMHRADLFAQPDLQIAVEPSERWLMLMFNFANPNRPRDAFDAEGNPRDQQINPTVGDLAVRQALQHAIDVDQLIDVVYQGYAEPLNSLWPPTSWAHDNTRPTQMYDFRAAEDILQAAGWWDANGDGIRECRECATAEIGTPLSLNMIYDTELDWVGQLIASQLYRIGVEVRFDGGLPSEQRFDLYLTRRTTSFTSDPDISPWFMREYDRRYEGFTAPNYGSFYDETVEQLFTQARTVDSCEIPARRDLYQQIQDELDAQTAVIPLLVEQDMIVAQPSVLGFDPLPGRPLWNIRDWVVMP